MAYTSTTMTIHYIVVLLIILNLHGENRAETLICSASREENKIVNIKNSREISNTTRAIKGLNLTEEDQCKQKCCDYEDCTVYVYYNSRKRQFNCFLIHCSPTSSCVRSSLVGSVVGVMKRGLNTGKFLL